MRGRVLVIEWQESEAELAQLYKGERDSVLKTRWHFLWLVRRGGTATAAATTVGIADRTGRTWVRWYREGGLAALRGHREGGKGQRARLTVEQLVALKARASQTGFISAQDAMTWVQQHFQVTYRPDGMYALFRRLGLRWKVPRPQHPKASPTAQAAWKKGGSRRR